MSSLDYENGVIVTACHRPSLDIKPIFSCEKDILTVRWPTDITVTADTALPPRDVITQVNKQLLKSTPILDLLIITLKPPYVQCSLVVEESIVQKQHHLAMSKFRKLFCANFASTTTRIFLLSSWISSHLHVCRARQ